ncbi:GAF domain-containing protein [Pseudonocardia sp. RS010]|uniref:GAF domain-containing protein n=1 Tax=Pseudonocardia sp. RS010 TaxID=3385979 RepID=UPI00399F1C46
MDQDRQREYTDRARELSRTLAQTSRALHRACEEAARHSEQLAAHLRPPAAVDHTVTAKRWHARAEQALATARMWESRQRAAVPAPRPTPPDTDDRPVRHGPHDEAEPPGGRPDTSATPAGTVAGARGTAGSGAVGPRPDEPLSFVDVPRLELDELLEQLVERAEEVLATQSRLRGLLRAHRAVGSNLDLPVLLRRIVSEARALIGADFAALGVLGADGNLVEFVHEGMPGDAVASIGHLPEGHGILGALIDDPHPIRLRDLSRDPRSCGFPPGHPPMGSFLGVPIRVRDEVFGNLYLTDKHDDGAFTADDEELIQALAVSAGVAIDNAVLLADTRKRQAWQAAATGITTDLLAGAEPTVVLEHLVTTVRDLGDSDGALLLVPTDDPDELLVAVAEGDLVTHLEGLRIRDADHAGAAVVPADEPLVVDDADGDPRTDGSPFTGIGVGPLLLAPMTGASGSWGSLGVCRARGRERYRPREIEAVASLAGHAALVAAAARVRVEQELRSRHDDRDRIAHDLNTLIIHDLLALGTRLTGLAGKIADPAHRRQLLAHAGQLDHIARNIGSSVFDLYQHPDDPGIE